MTTDILRLAVKSMVDDEVEGPRVILDPLSLEAFYRAAQREALTQAATIIRADKWPLPRSAYDEQYNQLVEALALRVEQIGETK